MVEIVWVDQSLHDRALLLVDARRDKSYSLCDAVSFVLMKERGILDALTTDHHFEQEGFQSLLGYVHSILCAPLSHGGSRRF